jgi:hypothetical protein
MKIVKKSEFIKRANTEAAQGRTLRILDASAVRTAAGISQPYL